MSKATAKDIKKYYQVYSIVSTYTGQEDAWSRGNAFVDLEAKCAASDPVYQDQRS